MIIAGNGIYEKCLDCGKLVKINKWCGDLHFCLSEDQRQAKRQFEHMARQQMNYKPIIGLGAFGSPLMQRPTEQKDEAP